MDNKKNKNMKYSSKIISATLLVPALTNVVAHASVTDYSIVDERTKLESAVNIAESFANNLDLTDNEDKKILSKDLLEPALNAALIILNNEESSLEDVVKINSILNKTLLFIENMPTVKKSELELSSRLYNIKKFISEAEESSNINKYPVAAIELLSQKVDYCEELLKDRILASEDLINVSTLTIDESVKEFKKVALLDDVDKSALNDIILIAEKFQNQSIIIGVKRGEYHKVDYDEFGALLTNARDMAKEDFVTDAESVAKMVQDLQDLMDEFPDRKITQDNILQDKIDEVTLFIENIVCGNDLGNFSEEAKQDLDNKLKVAKDNINEDIPGYDLYEIYEKLIESFEVLKSTEILEVDKTELKSLIEDAERLYASITKGDKPGQYYETDYNELRAEIDMAIVVVGNKQASVDLVKTTHLKLQTFKNNFSSKQIKVEDIKKDELNLLLDEAIALYDLNKMNAGFDKGQYLLIELETFYDEIQKADSIFTDQTVSQKEVDDAKSKLSESVQKFKDSVITADKSKLKISLDKALQLLNDTVVGSQSGHYPAAAKEELRLIYDSAMNIYETVHFDSNQSDIDTAVSTLDLAVDIYLKSIIVDLESLSTSISEAQSLYESNLSNIGVDMGNCLEESLEPLLNAINEANLIYEKEFATQEEINNAQSELANAILEFKDSIVTVDKSELKENISIAEKLIEDTTVGTNPGQYPESQREALYSVLGYARATYLNQHKDESLISSAAQTLSKSIQEYMDSVIKEEEKEEDNSGSNSNGGANPNVDYLSLDNSIDKARYILDNNPNISYFENEIKAINVALDNAEKIKKAPEVTQVEVDNIAQELDAKVSAFSQAETTHIQNVRQELQSLINESKKLIQDYYDRFSSIGSSDIISGSVSQLEKAIADSESLLLLNNNIIADYDLSYNNLYKLKVEFDLLINGDSSSNDGTNNDNNNNNNNNNNNADKDEDTISEEESLLVEEYKEKITDLLLQIRVALSTTEVGFKSNNCSENNKKATMYMYLIVENNLNDCERIDETKALYNKANATLLDFANKSISITESGVVNGKNLTGIVKNLTKVPAGEVISHDEEFIPNAGMPIDVKAWMTVLGSSFIGLGAFFKRKK